jgi:hypothetical protein
MKCPQLPLSADTVNTQLGDTSGDIEFRLRIQTVEMLLGPEDANEIPATYSVS